MNNRKKNKDIWVTTGVFHVLPLMSSFSNPTPAKEIIKTQDQYVDPYRFRHCIRYYNEIDDEPLQNLINNDDFKKRMLSNIPWFECPGLQTEQIYYFRWWVFRKHIKKPPHGYVTTEFLPEAGHSQKYNTILCAAGLHIEEGRWLRNRQKIR